MLKRLTIPPVVEHGTFCFLTSLACIEYGWGEFMEAGSSSVPTGFDFEAIFLNGYIKRALVWVFMNGIPLIIRKGNLKIFLPGYAR